MNGIALHHATGDQEVRRYGLAAAAIVALHVIGISVALSWYTPRETEGVVLTAITVDLAPAPSAEQIQTQDIAPGPEMEEAEAPPPEPPTPQDVVEEQLPPTPVPQSQPVVAAPPKVEQKAKPEPVKQKTVRREVKKKPSKKPPAPRTAAAPKAERVGREAPAPSSSVNSAAAAASYRATISAHLQRYKRYPSSAEANRERGTAMVSFVVNRNGRVTSSRLARSSGFASLDQETMALIQRAQPLPPFPAEIRQSAMTFTLPYSFTR